MSILYIQTECQHKAKFRTPARNNCKFLDSKYIASRESIQNLEAISRKIRNSESCFKIRKLPPYQLSKIAVIWRRAIGPTNGVPVSSSVRQCSRRFPRFHEFNSNKHTTCFDFERDTSALSSWCGISESVRINFSIEEWRRWPYLENSRDEQLEGRKREREIGRDRVSMYR